MTRPEQGARTETHVPRAKNAGKPTLSTAGNPFPAKLTPVFVELDPPRPGQSWDTVWPRPLPAVLPVPDFSGMVTTDEYIYEKFEPGENWPRLKLRLIPRREHETDAQYEDYRRGIERHTRVHGVYLGMCQMLCTWLGNFETCAEGPCRRNGECCVRRDEDTTEISFAIYPPCVPIDLDIIESYRAEINKELDILCAEAEAERRGR